MTRRLLLALAEVHASPLGRAGLALVCLVFLPFAVVFDALTRWQRAQEVAAVLRQGVVLCPRGHRVDLIGGWTCPTCGLAYEGHGFSCPHCGASSAAAVRCACGLSVRSPLWEPT